MEYPLGANSAVGACKPTRVSGIQNPTLRHPLFIAGSQKRRHGTGGGFFLRRAGFSQKEKIFSFGKQGPRFRSPNAPPPQPQQQRILVVGLYVKENFLYLYYRLAEAGSGTRGVVVVH